MIFIKKSANEPRSLTQARCSGIKYDDIDKDTKNEIYQSLLLEHIICVHTVCADLKAGMLVRVRVKSPLII